MTEDEAESEWVDGANHITHALAIVEGAGAEIMIRIDLVEPGSCKWIPQGGWCVTLPNLPDLADPTVLEESGGLYNIEPFEIYLSHQEAAGLSAALQKKSKIDK